MGRRHISEANSLGYINRRQKRAGRKAREVENHPSSIAVDLNQLFDADKQVW